MKAKVTWILIADGATAKVFEHSGPGRGLKAVDGLMFEQESLKAGEIMADRPGRSYSSVGHGRSAMEYSSDPVAVRERRFVEHVAGELERRHQQNAFDRLIVAAAPTALGDLRPALSKGVRDTIIAELPKDLTNTPTAQLESHFADLLPV
ncbi:MAG: host attachment protein [Devosia sp.]|uniref:host attachment protein n=1 Tax=Devosia sp. TaxID=1871048 RepID=UPI001AC176D7|nr:host attachment protein [Devosia sp.]MBN9309894.1 host attachment protein [Devosia sp.]MBN9316546.1 host attachment protein [Devosia sp.]